MKLKTKLMFILISVFLLSLLTIELFRYYTIKTEALDDLRREARNIRSVLMATRRVYHHQFLESGIPLTEKTIGFLPAHAMSRISRDFINWKTSDLYFNNVSDRPRNPDNAADRIEREAISYFRENPTETERFVPFNTPEKESFYHFAAPIWVEEYCLKCHGKREDSPVTIRTNYATSFNYKAGELRGVMSIKLPANHLNARIWTNFRQDLWIHLASFLGMFFLISWLLNRYVNKPLKIITSGLETVASGNLDYSIVGLSGEMAIVSNTFNDMSERLKKRENALKESEERYRKLLDTAQDTILCDLNGSITEWNKSAENLFGYSKAEIIGKDVAILIPDKYKKEHQEGLERFLKTGEARIIGKTVEVSGVTKDGIEIPIEISLTAQKVGTEQYYFMAIIRDLTERKKMEEELLKSNELLSKAEEIGNMGSWEWDTISNTVKWSEGLCCVHGIDPGTFTGRYEDAISFIHPDDRGLVTDSVKKMLDEQKSRIFEYRIIRPDGNERNLSGNNKIILDEEGKPIKLIGAVLDITDRKKMEDTLSQSEKLKSIGTITAGISHEFNNLLAIISGNVQLLEGTYKDHGDLTDAFRTIRKATDDGAEICSKMLGFTKTAPDTKKFVSSDIRDLIMQSIDFTKPRWKNEAQAKGIDYKMDAEGMKSVLPILCNSTELREVFINLIINALDAMPEGGTITVATRCVRRGEFGVKSEKAKNSELKSQNSELKGDFVEIIFADTGEGMSDEVKKSIFDPFFTTKSPVGTGLGMSTAYGIITRHGGKIEVESEVGNGSTFKLQFPITTKTVSPIATPEPEQEIKNKGQNILVVDDEEAICNVLDIFLSRVGYKVKTVDNGADAINIIKTENFDLVLCDLSMPDVFGYDVIKALNGLEKRPKIGVITGWGKKLDAIGGVGMKVDFVARKPFNFSELTKNINEAFGV